MDTLLPLGWHPYFEATFDEWRTQACLPARVLAEYQHLYRVITPQGEVLARISGRFQHRVLSREDYPAVGDWLALSWRPEMDQGRIEAVLPRRSAFVRQRAGGRSEAQVVAANVDWLLFGLVTQSGPQSAAFGTLFDPGLGKRCQTADRPQ